MAIFVIKIAPCLSLIKIIEKIIEKELTDIMQKETIDMKSLHEKLLEIAIYLDSFCKEHNVNYYLMGGSTLGALRHHGFIPWNDDFDVFMTYNNYIKFLKLSDHNLDKDRFYLQEENTDEWPLFFTKLRMNGTTYLEENTKNSTMHKGIYIDVFCLNNISDNKIYRFMQYLAALLLTAQSLSRRGYKTNKNFVKKTVMFFAHCFVRGKIKQFLLIFARGLNLEKIEYVGNFFDKAPFQMTCFPVEWLGNPRYVSFENVMLPIPVEAEKYLKLRYGDYMKMPDEKTLKKYPPHAYFVDVNNDYSIY